MFVNAGVGGVHEGWAERGGSGLARVLVGTGAGMLFHRDQRVDVEGIGGDGAMVVEWWRAHGRRRTMLVSSSMVNRVAILCALAVASATSGSAMTDRSQKSDNPFRKILEGPAGRPTRPPSPDTRSSCSLIRIIIREQDDATIRTAAHILQRNARVPTRVPTGS